MNTISSSPLHEETSIETAGQLHLPIERNPQGCEHRSILETLPLMERPSWRVTYQADRCNFIELLAVLIGGRHQIEIAQALLAKFGTAHALARATTIEIQHITGVGPATATRIQSALEFGRRMTTLMGNNESPQIQSPEDAACILIPRMAHLDQEHFVVLLLDTRNRLMGEPVVLYRGSLNSALVRVGEVYRPAIRANAAAILIAHNHPSGSVQASPEDVALTRVIVEAGKLIDIEILDHLIIGQGCFSSLKSKGLGFD